jgi:hypothetical protein
MNADSKSSENEILDLVRWWEKKRIIFNLCVGVAGLIMLFILGLPILKAIPLEIIFYILFYGVVVNGFYTLGWVCGILRVVYFKRHISIGEHKEGLFYFGTFLSVFITVVLSIVGYKELLIELQLKP